MLGNMLFTLFYLSVGSFLAFAAWTGYFDVPSLLVWVGAGIFLIVGLWRLLHLSKGTY
jgi:hypothetical protein